MVRKLELYKRSCEVHAPAGSYLDEGGATRLALVRFLARVDAQVSLQVGRSVELSATHTTAVRLLTCRHNRLFTQLDLNDIFLLNK